MLVYQRVDVSLGSFLECFLPDLPASQGRPSACGPYLAAAAGGDTSDVSGIDD